MTKLKANMSLTAMIDNFTYSLAEYARWPDVEARRISIDQDIAILHDALHGFDPVIPNALYLQLFAELVHDVNLREIPSRGLRTALLKIADVIDPPQSIASKKMEKQKEATP
jgi:hypothetical protein